MSSNNKQKTCNIASPPNLEKQLERMNSIFYPNSAYRSVINKIPVKIKMPTEIVSRYINAMVAYEALKSDENYKHFEKVKEEYKDFLDKNIS